MVVVRRVVEGDARRSAVERFNDGTLEWVIAILRGATVPGAAWVIFSTIMLIWSADLRWLATLVVVLIVTCVTGAAGFWYFGNGDWRDDGPAHR